MRRRTGIVVVGLLVGLLLSACSSPDGPVPLPHGGSPPRPSGQVLSDTRITAWLAAVQHYYQLTVTDSIPQSALTACYLLTRAQANADLSHPAQGWSLRGPLLGAPPRTAATSLTCVLSLPGTQISFGTAYGDAGGLVEVQASTSRRLPSSYREAVIPGTDWVLDYTAWHLRRPTDAELSWVLTDVVHNLAVPPPTTPLPAFLTN